MSNYPSNNTTNSSSLNNPTNTTSTLGDLPHTTRDTNRINLQSDSGTATGLLPNSGYSTGFNKNTGSTSGASGLPSTQTGLNSGYSGTSGLGSNQTGLNTGLSSIPSNQSGLNSGMNSGLSSNNPSSTYDSNTHSHRNTAAAGATGAALGAAAASHNDHASHSHPHHHEHTGHHPHTGTHDRSLGKGDYDSATHTGNPTATGGALHRAGIGHDPTVNTTGTGTAAAAGGFAGANTATGGLHGLHGTHGTHGIHGTHATPGSMNTTQGMQGTGLASGFALNTANVGGINPATGAPDYMATQHANIDDNVAGRHAPGAVSGAALGATTAAAASKMATSHGLPKRVLMVLTSSKMEMPDGKNSGFHWSEVFHPFEVFKKHGYDVDLTSLTGQATPDYHSVNWIEQLTGFELASMNAWRSKSHPLHKLLENIRTPQHLQASNYGIIYFTGGHATLEDFPTASAYQRMAAEIYERHGIVCAVCHGVCCLGNVRLSNGNHLLSGRQVTGFSEEGEKQMKVLDFMHKHNYPLISDTVSRAGGHYVGPNKPFEEFVIDSDRVITGPNPASAGPVAERAVRILEGR